MASNMLGFIVILAIVSPALLEMTKGGRKISITRHGHRARILRLEIGLYPVRAHNVFKVNGTGFESCIKPALTEALTSENDAIVLATPGRKWYICGIGRHCAAAGQKLFIIVNSEWMAPSPSPSPSENSANGIIPKFFPTAMMVALIVSIFGLSF
ncbi:hypothetical protein RJ640_026010 [Escallonia rubra]|uniref:Phytocyanin domain-containing protein n=1 Tax=Escallonia rubra TaxID=112253 RepID=A0AA88UUQ5_9ASTE|nr:hypothetical protein RJ640_026010 [Escallonia rubra]